MHKFKYLNNFMHFYKELKKKKLKLIKKLNFFKEKKKMLPSSDLN